MLDIGYYKLDGYELDKLVHKGIITPEERNEIIKLSRARKPGEFAKTTKRIYLNKAETVYIQNIHFYGGENFNKPYNWLAEISSFTKTGLTRFLNANSLRYPHMNY